MQIHMDIQPELRPCDNAEPLVGLKIACWIMLNRLFMVVNLYLPEIHSPGQDLAPSPFWRVASGSLSLISRRFFINQNLLRGNDRGIATELCCEYRGCESNFPN
jgi:hypothetical protein